MAVEVFDKREMRAIEKMFKTAPGEIKKATNQQWGKEGTKIKKQVARTSFTRSSPVSVGKGPNKVYKSKGGVTGQYGHLKDSLIRKVKFKGGGSKGRSFGGYMRIGYKAPGPGSKGFVGMWQEWGTDTRFKKSHNGQPSSPRYAGRNPAKQPIKHGWEKSNGAKNMVDVTNRGIILGLERAAKKS